MKKLLIFIGFIILIVFFLNLINLINENFEGFWVCDNNNQWVKKGNPSYPKPIRPCKPISLPKNKEDCLKIGGIWEKQGLIPFEICNRKAIDRGNLCRDSRECEGNCQVELTNKQLRQGMQGKISINKKYGKCSTWVVEFGCQGIMNKGKVMVICLD